MKSIFIGLVSAASLLLIPLTQVLAEEGNWRQGRIYYRMVCTDCHKTTIGQGISPMTRTIEEWKAYIAEDRHNASDKGNPSVSYYVSKEYRNSVKDTNKAASKFIDMPDEELLANLRAFLAHGAKDSDTPARCQ